jgi:hypothetical protein
VGGALADGADESRSLEAPDTPSRRGRTERGLPVSAGGSTGTDEPLRFDFRAGWLLRALLLPFGATNRRLAATLEGRALRVQLGALFDHVVDLGLVDRVERSRWPLVYGLGCRIGAGRKFGVIASTENVVRLHFRERVPLPALGPWTFGAEWLYLSLEEPDRFVAEVQARLA